jgi:hypothetical protein
MSDSNENKVSVVEPAKPLVPSYLNHSSALQPTLDMTAVYKYEYMVEDIAVVNSMNGPLYMKEFLKAKELTSSFYSGLLLDFERAKNETKKQAALAYLERSQDYIKARGLKDTDETKKQYINLDAGYQQAKDKEDMLRALCTLMGNKVDKFQNAYEATKKIFENSGQAIGSRTALPSYKDES